MKLESEKALPYPQIKQNTPKPRPPIKPEPEKLNQQLLNPLKRNQAVSMNHLPFLQLRMVFEATKSQLH